MVRSKKRRLADAIGEPATIIGQGTEIRGEIRSDGHILVMGVVRGHSEMQGSVTLADGASWIGTLRGDDLIVSGSVEGDLEATDRVEIRPTARIKGNVTASRISIGEGAVVEGEFRTTSETEPSQFADKRDRA